MAVPLHPSFLDQACLISLQIIIQHNMSCQQRVNGLGQSSQYIEMDRDIVPFLIFGCDAFD